MVKMKLFITLLYIIMAIHNLGGNRTGFIQGVKKKWGSWSLQLTALHYMPAGC